MKVYTKEIIAEIEKNYLAGKKINRSENIFYQRIEYTRKAGIKYLMDSDELEEYIKCKLSVHYFAEKYCRIKLEDGSIGPMKLRDYQKEAIEHFVKNKFSIFFRSRQVGLQVVMCITFLHETLFNKDKSILLVSYKGESNNEIVRGIKNIYALLPFFLKQGIVNWNEKQMVFENGSRLFTYCPVKEFGIGYDPDIVFLNEFSKMPNAERIYDTLVPIISSKKDSKLIIHSGPNGFNFFYQLVQNSERPIMDPSKNSFETMRTYWWQVAGRDQKWKAEQIKMLGSEAMFNQEYDLCWITL